MRLLQGLNEQYSNIRSHVLLMDLLPSMTKIFSYVIQQECQLPGSISHPTSNSLVNDATVNSCTYCGCSDHSTNFCYHKRGFPTNGDAKHGKSSTYNPRRFALIVDVRVTLLMHVISNMVFLPDINLLMPSIQW